MTVINRQLCARVCNCSDCALLKCMYKPDNTGSFDFLYYCEKSSTSFPYGISCARHKIYIYKVYAVIDSDIRKTIHNPFYVFAANESVAAGRFKKSYPLLGIRKINRCEEQEGIDILQSDDIPII